MADAHLKCGDDAVWQEEIAKYGALSTYPEYLVQWGRFYDGLSCVPTYMDSLVGGADNTHADRSHAAKFKKLTIEKMILPDDWQPMVKSSTELQREYLSFVAPAPIAHAYVEWLNQQDGIVAFRSHPDTPFDAASRFQWPITTYESYGKFKRPFTYAVPMGGVEEIIESNRNARHWMLCNTKVISAVARPDHVLNTMLSMPTAAALMNDAEDAEVLFCENRRALHEKIRAERGEKAAENFASGDRHCFRKRRGSKARKKAQ
jgi:hypothetical protein